MPIGNYYIGVGGTGARVAEALVHLCAAGLGPDELFLMLIDPDAGNGNLSRTTELVASYQRIHQQIGLWADGVDLFHTRIVTAPDNKIVWNIIGEQNQTLASFMALDSLDEPLKHLTELLFTEEDLREKLNEGFRGRPAIGAVVMAHPDESVPPWSSFWQEIGNVSRADEAKVFVVGSVFGGTGAAGIPTLGAGKVIRERAALDAEAGTSKIYLGSCLVLPYFTFPASEQSIPVEQRARLFVTPDDFPLATSSALYYYLTKKLAYDEVYLIGDSGSEEVGHFSAGAASQKNRAHYVELGAALSALDFFAHGTPQRKREPQYFISARNGVEVTWKDLPAARVDPEHVQAIVKYRLSSAALFFFAICKYGRKELSRLVNRREQPPAWFHEVFERVPTASSGSVKTDATRLDPRSADQDEMIKRLEAFGARLDADGAMIGGFLEWLREVTIDRHVSLLNMSAVLDAKSGKLLDPDPAQVYQLVDKNQQKVHFNTFVGKCLLDDGAVEAARSAPIAADKYFNLFAVAANRFTEKYLNVPRPDAKG